MIGCQLLAGAGIGWLAGLSVSPVIQGVITGLVTASVAVSSVLAGIRKPDVREERPDRSDESESEPKAGAKRESRSSVDAMPVAVLIIGIAVGAPLGICVRAHNWLGTESHASGDAASAVKASDLGGGVLYVSLSSEERERLLAASDEMLLRVMSASHNERVRAFATRCGDNPQCLRAAVEELICHK